MRQVAIIVAIVGSIIAAACVGAWYFMYRDDAKRTPESRRALASRLTASLADDPATEGAMIDTVGPLDDEMVIKMSGCDLSKLRFLVADDKKRGTSALRVALNEHGFATLRCADSNERLRPPWW